MKRMLLAFAPFALATLAVVGLRAAPELGFNETERVTRSFPLTRGGAARGEALAARVDIGGPGREEVVTDPAGRAPRSPLNHNKLYAHSNGPPLRGAPTPREPSWGRGHDGVVEPAFNIRVPRR